MTLLRNILDYRWTYVASTLAVLQIAAYWIGS